MFDHCHEIVAVTPASTISDDGYLGEAAIGARRARLPVVLFRPPGARRMGPRKIRRFRLLVVL